MVHVFLKLLKAAKVLVFNSICGGDYGRYLELRALAVRIAARWDLYERSNVKFMHSYLRPGDTAVDVGANLGAYSIAMARSVGAAGKVFSFEPIPETFDLLKKNTQGLQQTESFPIALSDRKEKKTIHVPIFFGDVPEISMAGIGVKAERYQSRTVQCACLDEYLPQLKGLRFIKADIEGHEPAFFLGAKSVIDTYRPLIQFEANPDSAAWNEITAFAREHDYDVCRLMLGRLEILDHPRADEFNFYLSPRGRI